MGAQQGEVSPADDEKIMFVVGVYVCKSPHYGES